MSLTSCSTAVDMAVPSLLPLSPDADKRAEVTWRTVPSRAKEAQMGLTARVRLFRKGSTPQAMHGKPEDFQILREAAAWLE